jgi:hypothetical protein
MQVDGARAEEFLGRLAVGALFTQIMNDRVIVLPEPVTPRIERRPGRIVRGMEGEGVAKAVLRPRRSGKTGQRLLKPGGFGGAAFCRRRSISRRIASANWNLARTSAVRE